MYMLLDKSSFIIKKVKVAFGGMAPTPVLAKRVASVLTGQKFDLNKYVIP